MVPSSHFDAQVPTSERPASAQADPHGYAMARLRHERKLRQALETECTQLDNRQKAAEKHVASQSGFLLGLPDRVRAISAASKPLQQHLGPADAAVRAAVARGDQLPQPLLVAWRALTAAAASNPGNISIAIGTAASASSSSSSGVGSSLTSYELAEWKTGGVESSTAHASAARAKRDRDEADLAPPEELFRPHPQTVELSIATEAASAGALSATVTLSLLPALGLVTAKAVIAGSQRDALAAAAANDAFALSQAILAGLTSPQDTGERVPILAMHHSPAPLGGAVAAAGGDTACLVQAALLGAGAKRLPKAVRQAVGGAYLWAASMGGATCLPERATTTSAAMATARALIKQVQARLSTMAQLAGLAAAQADPPKAATDAIAALKLAGSAEAASIAQPSPASPRLVRFSLVLGHQAAVNAIGEQQAQALAAAASAPSRTTCIASIADTAHEEFPGADDALAQLWDESTLAESTVASAKRTKHAGLAEIEHSLDGSVLLCATLADGRKLVGTVAPTAQGASASTAFAVVGADTTGELSPATTRGAELAGSAMLRSSATLGSLEVCMLAAIEAARCALASE
jgi:hypothetical protein